MNEREADFKLLLKQVRTSLMDLYKHNRERSMAITKLDELELWTTKATLD